MFFDNLLSNAHVLLQRMREDGYSEGYARRVETELNWLEANGGRLDSYEAACLAREAQTGSASMKGHYRAVYGLLMRFDLLGKPPDFGRAEPLFKRGARQHLNGEFAEVIAAFEDCARLRGLAESTIGGYAANASCFLLAMQDRGLSSLAEMTEDDVLSFFAGRDGRPALSHSYAKNVRAVLTSDLGPLAGDAHAVAALLPHIRPKRKNIQYLQPEEVEAVRAELDDPRSSLPLREKAMGALLLFAGLRACDIAGLTMDCIIWERDEIRIVQKKTGSPLVLPLTAPIGNAILDYLEGGRPESDDPHVFLALTRPHRPLAPASVWNCARRLYDAAGIRPRGERRGTHLFRHNAATAMVGADVPRPVVSAVLGHDDPGSLDYYLSADIAHLRECALDVGRFPVREGAFDL